MSESNSCAFADRLGWPLRVLGAASSGAALLVALYVAIFVALVPRPTVPFIKEIMLQYAPGPRIIFDSGSSAVYGIDVAAVGAALHRFGFIASDNGNVSPLDKAYRLERYARPGDVVVLPFEWIHYDAPEHLNLAYVEAATGFLSGYFRASPWPEKLRLIASLPLGAALRIMERNAATLAASARNARPLDRVQGLEVVVAGGWTGGLPTPPRQLLPDAAATTCAHSIFDGGQLGRGPDRDGLRRLLAALRRTQDRGVRIAFIPPIVAGTDCYADRAGLASYMAALHALLAQYGLHYLGSPSALWFPRSDATNTYYHVDAAARAQATERIIGWLRQAGFAATAAPRDGGSIALRRLELDRMKGRWPKEILPLDRETRVGSPALEMVAGWWGKDADTIWSRGSDALLRIRVPVGTRALVLRVQAYAAVRPADFLVNGRLVLAASVGGGPQTVTLPVPPGDGRLEITLRSSSALPIRSPRDLGLGTDPRPVGFGLLGVTPTR
jgi:hypothetical protein